jgi:esterase/lipase superfamily enzyme
MANVYFATNRVADPTKEGGYGADIVANDPAAVTYAVAAVDQIDLNQADAGVITAITDKTPGGYSDAATKTIIQASRNLLVFIHGFDNSFAAAIRRAAFNQAWLAASGVPAGDTTVLAFTWPSAGQLLEPFPSVPDAAYKLDQTQAGKSAFHLAYFLNNVDQLARDFRAANPAGRVFLLAHSMGNYALQGAVQWWFASRGSNDLMFDETILAAADEVDDTFDRPGGGRLSQLPALTQRISIYYSRKDVAMWLSTAVNGNDRLGFDGPDDKSDATKYPAAKFRMIDCTAVGDFDPPVLSQQTHQYYRCSPIVRSDIVALLNGAPVPAGGQGALPRAGV